MLQSRCIIGLLITCFVASQPGFSAPASAKPNAKVDRLEVAFRTIGETSRTERHVTGSGMLMLAAASGTAAVFANQSSNPSLAADGPLAFGLLATAFGLGGFLTLAIRREYETIPEAFSKMPERTTEEVQAKVKFGEAKLRALNDRARNERLWSASIAASGSAVFLIWYAANSNYLGGATLYISGFCAFISLASFFSESTTEQEYLNYRSGDDLNLSWGIAPLPQGAALQAALRF